MDRRSQDAVLLTVIVLSLAGILGVIIVTQVARPLQLPPAPTQAPHTSVTLDELTED